MPASVEFITATIFAVIMILIGLGAIWIVRWQTYFILRNQGTSPDGVLFVPTALLFSLMVRTPHLCQATISSADEYYHRSQLSLEVTQSSLQLSARH
jgi:hypothetical protein